MAQENEVQVIQAPNSNRNVQAATLQEVVDSVDRVESTISQLGVEVQRILGVLEGIAKSLEQIADSANNR